MVTREDFVVIKFDDEQIAAIENNAAEATIGGKSCIRSAEDRSKTCKDDQIVGQMCELALHMFVFGKKKGFNLWKKVRDSKNKTRYQGDNGQDLFDGTSMLDIDIKGSRLKTGKRAISYNLVVNPGDPASGRKSEYHDNWIYIAAFCGRNEDGSVKNDSVVMTGWVKSKDIAEPTDWMGYGLRHWRPISKLRPLSTLTEDIIMAQKQE